MRLLLDTHIWVWSLSRPTRLSRRVARALSRTDSEIWISPISVWELLLLSQRKRLELKPEPRTWISSARELAPFRDAAMTHEVALATLEVSLPHDDPADRWLAATARALDLTLVTADTNLMEGRGFAILPNE